MNNLLKEVSRTTQGSRVHRSRASSGAKRPDYVDYVIDTISNENNDTSATSTYKPLTHAHRPRRQSPVPALALLTQGNPLVVHHVPLVDEHRKYVPGRHRNFMATHGLFGTNDRSEYQDEHDLQDLHLMVIRGDTLKTSQDAYAIQINKALMKSVRQGICQDAVNETYVFDNIKVSDYVVIVTTRKSSRILEAAARGDTTVHDNLVILGFATLRWMSLNEIEQETQMLDVKRNAPIHATDVLRARPQTQNNVEKTLEHLRVLNEGFMYMSTICSNFRLGSFIMHTLENDQELRTKTSQLGHPFGAIKLASIPEAYGFYLKRGYLRTIDNMHFFPLNDTSSKLPVYILSSDQLKQLKRVTFAPHKVFIDDASDTIVLTKYLDWLPGQRERILRQEPRAQPRRPTRVVKRPWWSVE